MKEEDLMETSTHTVDRKMIWVALISISAAIILGLLGPPRTVVQAHTASELIYIYMNNESSADARYIGRTVQITGTIHSVQQDTTNNTVELILQKSETFELYQIVCSFTNKEDLPPDITKGQTVTVQGICDGITAYDIDIRNCVLVQ